MPEMAAEEEEEVPDMESLAEFLEGSPLPADAEEEPLPEEEAEGSPPPEGSPEDLQEGADEGADCEEPDLAAEEGVEVEEHLKDAVEGSLRLKRLLSRDEEDGSDSKRLKVDDEDPEKTALIDQLLTKWQLKQDEVVKHTLEQSTKEEIENLMKSSYVPDRMNPMKSPAELFGRYMQEQRERKMIGSMSVDAIAAFKFRWKIDIAGNQLLRKLSHKDLRYVFNNYDGSMPLEELVEIAKEAEVEETSPTLSALPKSSGLAVMARYNRLELIDPKADAAVFGDANLTFAMRLARHRKALGHVGRVIATTFEDLNTLKQRYPEIETSIKTLEDLGAEVHHEVDCTRFALDARFKGMEGSLGAVYYNFPHSGAIQGFFDGHPCVNWRHENLMRLFFRSLRSFVKPGGFVKIASNAGAVGVRYSFIIDSAITNEFLHVETVPFLQWGLHRYGRSYGDKRDAYKRPDAQNNQSYNAQRADSDMVYCFCYAPTGQTIEKQMIRLPPTAKTLQGCVDGPFKNLVPAGKINLAKQLHKRFLTEVGGTHVG